MEEPAIYNTKAPDYAGLLAKVTRLTMRADSADWAMQDVQAEKRVLLVVIDALTARAEKAEVNARANEALVLMYEGRGRENWQERAEKAEARVKEQQAELGEQETDKMKLITGVKDLCGMLYWATNAWTAELLAFDVRKKLRALLAGQSSPIELLNPSKP